MATVKDVPRRDFEDIFRQWLGEEFFSAWRDGDASGVTPLMRPPNRVLLVAPGVIRLRWNTDLSPALDAAFDDLIRAARLGLDYAPYQSIKTDITTLNQYLNNPSPTEQDLFDSMTSVIRVLRVLLRD